MTAPPDKPSVPYPHQRLRQERRDRAIRQFVESILRRGLERREEQKNVPVEASKPVTGADDTENKGDARLIGEADRRASFQYEQEANHDDHPRFEL